MASSRGSTFRLEMSVREVTIWGIVEHNWSGRNISVFAPGSAATETKQLADGGGPARGWRGIRRWFGIGKPRSRAQSPGEASDAGSARSAISRRYLERPCAALP